MRRVISCLIAIVLMIVIVGSARIRTEQTRQPSDAVLAWEELPTRTRTGIDLITHRAKVPGGWLIAIVGKVPQSGQNAPLRAGELPVGVAFLPDPDHRWNGRSE
jgi:hypothetical protein